MKTLSETAVTTAADEKKEPESKLAVPSGKRVSKNKPPNTAIKKLAPKKARKAARKTKESDSIRVMITNRYCRSLTLTDTEETQSN